MNATKDADLLLAVVRYILRALGERDFQALRRLRIGSDQLAALSQLRLADLAHLAHAPHHCLHIELDQAALARTLQCVAAARERERSKQALIDADANLPMLRRIFGMSSREYTGRRYLSATGAQRGRPRAPAETEERRVWEAWTARVVNRPALALTAQDYLALHRETGEVALRTIWTLTQRWARDEHCLRVLDRMKQQRLGELDGDG